MTLPTVSPTELILLLPDLLWGFLAIWLFAVGGCVGSFLNVVVLRMPQGISISRSGSRCPVCLHAIRWYDNIPVFGWLALRGRCRDCHTPISKRYPAVELLVALLFLALGIAEGLSGGANLPVGPETPPLALRYHPFQYWTLYTFHIVAVVTLLGATLIERDGHATPRRLFLPFVMLGLIASICLPFLHPIHVAGGVTSGTWLDGLKDVTSGALVGGVMGLLAWPATSRQPWRPQAGSTAVMATILVGICLGWQGASIVIATCSMLFLLASIWGCLDRPIGRGIWIAYLTLCLFVFLLCWKQCVERFPVLGPASAWWLLVSTAAIVLLASMTTSWFTPAREYLPFARNETREETKGMNMPVDRDENLRAILESPSYLPVEYDSEFLLQPETRPLRVQLELMKTEMGLMSQGVSSTVVVFGGTQVIEAPDAEAKLQAAREALEADPGNSALQRDVERRMRIVAKTKYYDAARAFGRLVSSHCQVEGKCDYVVVTGGGPGIMEAANRGAFDIGAKSIGLNITLPAEQAPNPYITPELCFQFHYFALRKMHFLMRAEAMVVFPGGFGTLDELFDALTLRQTHRMQAIPVILYGSDFWQHVVDFQFLADEGVIADEDLDLFEFANTPEEAWQAIVRFHNHDREAGGERLETGD